MTPSIDRSEALLPELVEAISASSPIGATVMTVAQGKPNRVVSIESEGVRVETERSLARGAGAELVPAWMLNAGWRQLTTFGSLTNAFLLNELNAKRSSAVCALLARVSGVEVVETRPITLALRK